ncbi:hypothetical protein EHS39_24785 [Ensifer sp. MPMI2T]|nr:hypothetical protein EHS39_24785 [Ensifer sp. MPMI2T]
MTCCLQRRASFQTRKGRCGTLNCSDLSLHLSRPAQINRTHRETPVHETRDAERLHPRRQARRGLERPDPLLRGRPYRPHAAGGA